MITSNQSVVAASEINEELQKALFVHLSTNLTLPIFDNVPQGAEAPYYTLGVPTVTPYETDGRIGFNILMPIHCWSEYRGKIEALKMQADVYSLLHRAKLQIDGLNCIKLDQESQTIILDSDGVTRHGIQQFRIIIIAEA